MNATATIAPAGPQYMRALERANKVRLARADLKRRISTGEIDVTDVLLQCPWETDSMAVADLLLSQRRWGQTRCRKFLAQLPVSEKKTIGSLTERQRQTLVAMLRGVGARAPISAGIEAAVPRRQTPPTMLDVPPARLRSRPASAIHGPTPSTHHLL
jgi:hypothetical protein